MRVGTSQPEKNKFYSNWNNALSELTKAEMGQVAVSELSFLAMAMTRERARDTTSCLQLEASCLPSELLCLQLNFAGLVCLQWELACLQSVLFGASFCSQLKLAFELFC